MTAHDEEKRLKRRKKVKKVLKIAGPVLGIATLVALQIVRALTNGSSEEEPEAGAGPSLLDPPQSEPAFDGPKYKVVYHYSSGESYEDDELFDSYEKADAAGRYGIACYWEGAETMEMSNPGDYPLFDCDEPDYEIVEAEE